MSVCESIHPSYLYITHYGQDAGTERNQENSQDKIFSSEEPADISRHGSATPSGRKVSIIAGISKQFSREGSSNSYTQFT